MVNINIEIDEETHKRLKIKATEKELTLKAHIIETLEKRTSK